MSPTNDPRRLALITGASAGIGAEYARQLAASGHDLVLTARRHERLAAMASELSEQHNIDCRAISADLADPQAPGQLCRELDEAGLTVDLLVNNAGYALDGRFNDSTWEEQAAFLQVMVTAVAELSHSLLPGMRERGRGGIINVASLAGIMPGSAGHTLYAAAKAFMIKFSESLAMENRSCGVSVQALCPGFTYSEFHDVVGTRDRVSRLPKWMWMNADAVVATSLDRFGDPRAPVMLVPGRVNRCLAALSRKLPYRRAFAMVEKRSSTFRRTGD